jgi:hypothetical protein
VVQERSGNGLKAVEALKQAVDALLRALERGTFSEAE